MNQSNIPRISIVIPLYNEETCLKSVCTEVYEVLSEALDETWELILVDDGSTDQTSVLINKFAQEYECVRAIHLAPNSGQSAAFAAGFNVAGGEIIGTLDGDGQNDPRDLPRLIEEMELQRVDMMCGIRAKRADNLIRKVSSRIANRARSYVLKDNISDVGCSIRVFRRACLQRLCFFRNFHRFFPALMIMNGYRVSETQVNHRPRTSGVSKYGGGIRSRLWVGIADLAGVFWLKKRTLIYQVSEDKIKV